MFFYIILNNFEVDDILKTILFLNFSVENCRTAMYLARDEFSIPMILTPEDLASHNLDELSGMTYLSYFMKDDSPGYKATLGWVQKQLPQFNIRNFTVSVFI